MKKFMVMLLIVFAGMFPLPLSALDVSPPGIEKVNSTTAGEMFYGKNGIGLVGAAHAVGCKPLSKIHILSKNTIMYSLDNGLNKKIPGISGGCKSNINTLAYANVVAGVTYAKSM